MHDFIDGYHFLEMNGLLFYFFSYGRQEQKHEYEIRFFSTYF